MAGHVYILVNETIPGLVKVGKTTGEVSARTNALSSATGVATPFQLFKSYAVTDCDAAEKFAHRVLESAVGRLNSNREFFNGPAEVVRTILDDALAPYFEAEDATLNKFEEAYRRFSRKENTFACIEFEAVLPSVGSSPMTYLMSAELQRALGTYLASCCATSRNPILQNCIFDPALKNHVVERAIEALKSSSSDPVADILSYMQRFD